MVYIFRHKDLGDIGRMFILPHGEQSQFVYEVTGDEDDPMTQQRRAIFEPIFHDIHAQMASTLGEGKGTPKPYQTPIQTQTINAEHITCSKCDVLVALIVYASQATTGASLEDHARMMFSKAKELNVPAWVLGKEKEVLVNNLYVSQFLSLKFWPIREPVRYILATEMDDILCPLVEKHCFASFT
jgi:hypothetical protein